MNASRTMAAVNRSALTPMTATSVLATVASRLSTQASNAQVRRSPAFTANPRFVVTSVMEPPRDWGQPSIVRKISQLYYSVGGYYSVFRQVWPCP